MYYWIHWTGIRRKVDAVLQTMLFCSSILHARLCRSWVDFPFTRGTLPLYQVFCPLCWFLNWHVLVASVDFPASSFSPNSRLYLHFTVEFASFVDGTLIMTLFSNYVFVLAVEDSRIQSYNPRQVCNSGNMEWPWVGELLSVHWWRYSVGAVRVFSVVLSFTAVSRKHREICNLSKNLSMLLLDL